MATDIPRRSFALWRLPQRDQARNALRPFEGMEHTPTEVHRCLESDLLPAITVFSPLFDPLPVFEFQGRRVTAANLHALAFGMRAMLQKHVEHLQRSKTIWRKIERFFELKGPPTRLENLIEHFSRWDTLFSVLALKQQIHDRLHESQPGLNAVPTASSLFECVFSQPLPSLNALEADARHWHQDINTRSVRERDQRRQRFERLQQLLAAHRAALEDARQYISAWNKNPFSRPNRGFVASFSNNLNAEARLTQRLQRLVSGELQRFTVKNS